jgi:hypothetical protein
MPRQRHAGYAAAAEIRSLRRRTMPPRRIFAAEIYAVLVYRATPPLRRAAAADAASPIDAAMRPHDADDKD